MRFSEGLERILKQYYKEDGYSVFYFKETVFAIKQLIKEIMPTKKELIKCPHDEIAIECESCAEQNKLKIQ